MFKTQTTLMDDELEAGKCWWRVSSMATRQQLLWKQVHLVFSPGCIQQSNYMTKRLIHVIRKQGLLPDVLACFSQCHQLPHMAQAVRCCTLSFCTCAGATSTAGMDKMKHEVFEEENGSKGFIPRMDQLGQLIQQAGGPAEFSDDKRAHVRCISKKKRE